MNFLSIKEFFYKVNTIGFILLLFPVIVFLYIHIGALKSFPIVEGTYEANILLSLSFVLIATILTVVNLIWRARIKHMKSYAELSKKMEGYFVLFVLRSGAYAACLLLMAGGYYFTHSIYYSGIFLLVLVVLLFQWPGPRRFCVSFELKGAERDLILHNQDLIGKTRKKAG